jgi:hypothetical protein
LWGYFDYIERLHKTEEELIDEQKKKLKEVGNVDWESEVKALKELKGK